MSIFLTFFKGSESRICSKSFDLGLIDFYTQNLFFFKTEFAERIAWDATGRQRRSGTG